MKQNVGSIDKVVRILSAVIFVGLVATGIVQGVLASVLGILAATFLITSFMSFCPLYFPFGFGTCTTNVTTKKIEKK
jgi:hypothetical protein